MNKLIAIWVGLETALIFWWVIFMGLDLAFGGPDNYRWRHDADFTGFLVSAWLGISLVVWFLWAENNE